MKKIEYYENGNKRNEYEVNENEKLHGIQKLYHENGQLQVELNWTNGIQDDETITSYHPNGTKARQVNRLQNKLNGEFLEWHDNGQLKRKGFYQDNFINGTYKTWDASGNLKNDFFKHRFIDTIDCEKFNSYSRDEKNISEIEVDWLQDIRPIYKKFINKNEITSTLQHTLDNEDEYMIVFSPNEEDAKNIIDTIINNNGGFTAFKLLESETWHYAYSGYLFFLGCKILVSDRLYVIEIHRHERREFISFNDSVILYGIHKDSKKVNKIIKGLNSIVYNSGEMTSGGGELFYTANNSHIVSYWDDLEKVVEKLKSIIDCYSENAFSDELFGEGEEIKDFTYQNIKKITTDSLWSITFKTDKFKINLAQGNSSYQMNIYLS